ncbi:GNAT family N-acetyltransferase [Orbus mooreae]|uniref:GNAT family N-acetyltransferase n=1 Tax=Orbus mooreae TaxID=3074107 RepID=UPI00370CFFC1
MIIRPYSSNDCPVLAKLFYDTVHQVNAKDYTKQQLDQWATGNIDLVAWNNSFLQNNTLIAESNGLIVGFADMDKAGYLDRLYVHKDFLRIGIATALVNQLEKRMCNMGVLCFKTNASITAKPFFKKQGYHVEAENKVIHNGIVLINYTMIKYF